MLLRVKGDCIHRCQVLPAYEVVFERTEGICPEACERVALLVLAVLIVARDPLSVVPVYVNGCLHDSKACHVASCRGGPAVVRVQSHLSACSSNSVMPLPEPQLHSVSQIKFSSVNHKAGNHVGNGVIGVMVSEQSLYSMMSVAKRILEVAHDLSVRVGVLHRIVARVVV